MTNILPQSWTNHPWKNNSVKHLRKFRLLKPESFTPMKNFTASKWNSQTQSSKMHTSQYRVTHTSETIHTPSVEAWDPIHENAKLSNQGSSQMWTNSQPRWNRRSSSTKMQTSQYRTVHTCVIFHIANVKESDAITKLENNKHPRSDPGKKIKKGTNL